MFAKVYKTPNFKYAIYVEGLSDSDFSELVTRTVQNSYGEAPTLNSKTQELIPKSQGYTDAQFTIKQSDPLGLNILALEIDFETNDN